VVIADQPVDSRTASGLHSKAIGDVDWSPASSSEAGRACLEEGGYRGEDASEFGDDSSHQRGA